MKHAALGAVVVSLCVLSFGCSSGGALSEQDKAAIQKLHEQYSQTMNTQNPAPAALVKDYYAADAKVLPPNAAVVQGLDAIAKGMAEPGPAKNFRIDTAATEGHGDLAYSHGTWEGDFSLPGGGTMHDKGKYLETWKKQADGTWKAIYDIWNSDLPAGFTVPTGEMKADAGPELKNLAWFVGAWQMDIAAKESPIGKAGKGATMLDCRWFVNGQTVFCKNDGTMPDGPYHELMSMSYDPGAKAYTAYDVDSAGVMSPFALTFQNNTWAMNYDLKMEGKPAKLRVTIENMTKDACTFKQELSTGGAWTLIADGGLKKVGG
jgi:ketosteroid isomerase-like protein